MLITHAQVDELLDTLVTLSGLDEELFERCGFLIRSERYDEAVSRAFVVLEERLRKSLGVRGGTGFDLAQKAFSPKSGDFVEQLRRPVPEVEGIRDLFVGAFRAYRNRAAHTVAGYSLDEARGIIHLVNLLLLILDQVSQAPTEPIPPQVAEALDPAATERLQLFLEKIKGIGYQRGKSKTLVPYKANLKYKVSSWPEPRPHWVSVFYVTKEETPPQLQFHSYGFSHVVGLDVDQLEAKLRSIGCKQTGLKERSLGLFLNEHNDQATFDRLYEILQEIVEEHGA